MVHQMIYMPCSCVMMALTLDNKGPSHINIVSTLNIDFLDKEVASLLIWAKILDIKEDKEAWHV